MTAAIPLVTGKQFPTTAPLPAYSAVVPARGPRLFVAILWANQGGNLEDRINARLERIEDAGGVVVTPIRLHDGVVVVTYRAAVRIEP